MANLVRTIVATSTTWTAPAGVTSVRVTAVPGNVPVIGNSAGINSDTCDGYAWGRNDSGGLGIGSITPQCNPKLICCGIKWRQLSISQAAASYGIDYSGNGYAWGSNQCGRLGINSITAMCLPTPICCGFTWKMIVGDPSSPGAAIGITCSGDAYAWGLNTCGALGVGTLGGVQCQPTLVSCGLKWVQVATQNNNSMGIDSNGCGYRWGLVGGWTCNNCRPAPICCGFRWKYVATGVDSLLGITSTGDLYAWGNGCCGQLGNNTSGSGSSTPKAVCCDFKWVQVTGGYGFALGITTCGDLWAWGTNTVGQLGIGSITSQCTPQLVCCGLKWRSVSAGGSLGPVIAITQSGDLYAWGGNSCGGLGNNASGTSVCLPTPVCCGFAWGVITSQPSKTFAVNPGAVYNVTTWGNYPSFNNEPIVKDLFTMYLILEYFA